MIISTEAIEAFTARPSEKAGSALCYDPATRLHVDVAIVPHTYFRLSMIRFRSARVAAMLLAVLLPALLCAQWTGMQHRVAHAWIAAAADHATSASDNDDTPHLAHSCTLFDAASLGVMLHSAFFPPACLRARMIDARPPAAAPAHAQAFKLFLPRAPPSA